MRRWPWNTSYTWAPEGVRPPDFNRFRAFAYRQWCWARGDVFWLAKFKPAILLEKYQYWRKNYA